MRKNIVYTYIYVTVKVYQVNTMDRKANHMKITKHNFTKRWWLC